MAGDMRILVFGKTGQVARELADLCAIRGIEAAFLGRDKADLSDPDACAAIINVTDADVIINAAAYTAVDKAESEPELAWLVNAGAPGAMARAAKARDIPFLHISTDYVFDGTGTVPWLEDDETGPKGVYGQTKLDGEKCIVATNGAHLILRTAWVFSAHGSNFVKTMLRVGAERDELSVVDDQRGGPTPAAAIAAALLEIAAAFHTGRGISGVYHFAGTPALSWAGFAEAIFEGSANPPKINRIRSDQYPTPAVRPANSVLNCAKIKRIYGIEQPDWRIALKDVLTKLEGQT